MTTVDILVYAGILIQILVIVWMIKRFIYEWPSYSRKNGK